MWYSSHSLASDANGVSEADLELLLPPSPKYWSTDGVLPHLIYIVIQPRASCILAENLLPTPDTASAPDWRTGGVPYYILQNVEFWFFYLGYLYFRNVSSRVCRIICYGSGFVLLTKTSFFIFSCRFRFLSTEKSFPSLRCLYMVFESGKETLSRKSRKKRGACFSS